MSNVSRFLFDDDFRGPRGGDAKLQAAVAEAEQRGHAAGVADGVRQAQADNATRLANAMQRLADGAATLLAQAEARDAALEQEALAFAFDLGRKLAGEALRLDALAPIAGAARAAFQHLRGVPHLVVRVNEAQVEEVDALLQRLARERGFEGRLIVLGEPEIALGDARLEWADGGIVRERSRVDAAVAGHIAADDPSL